MSTAKRITCVAVLANMAYKGHRSLMKGIVNYARAHGSWRFLVGGGSVNDPRFDCGRSAASMRRSARGCPPETCGTTSTFAIAVTRPG